MKMVKSSKSSEKDKKRFIFWVILGLILIVASFLRLYLINEYMTFLGDEGRDAIIVYNILHGKLTLLGPTASVGGFFLGPMYYYFMAPFLWLFQYNPVGPAIMVALFGIATVYLIYKIGVEFFGHTAGIVASFLYAISPLVVIYSHSSWNPNLIPFFSLVSAYFVYKAVLKNKSFFLFLAGISLGITIQLHYIAVFLITITVIFLFYANFVTLRIIQKARNRYFFLKIIKDYIYLFLGFVLGWAPFLAFEIRHNFANLFSIYNFIFHSKETGGSAQFFPTIFDVYFRVMGRLLFNFPAPLDKGTFFLPWVIPVLNFTIWALAFSFIFILARQNLLSIKNKSADYKKYGILLIWLTVGVALFGFYKKNIYDYYFGFLFPLPFLLFGYLFSLIWKKNIQFKFILLILLGLISFNLYRGEPLMFAPNNQLNQAREISQFILDKSEGKPFNFALITGGNSDHEFRYFFKLWGKEPVTIENSQLDPQRKTVTQQLLVVCDTDPCEPLGNSLWEVAGFGRAEIAGSWPVSVVKVYKLTHYTGKD